MRQWISRYRWWIAAVLLLVLLLGIVGTIAAQPPVPHAVMEGEDCLSCHQAGVSGAPRLAWDHLGRSNDDCAHCHEVSGALAGPITHPIAGREDCLSCHLEGTGNTPKLAGSHVDYTNDECQECHQLAPAAAEATPVPTEAPRESMPPSDTGTGSCVSCHQLIFADEQHAAFTGQPLGDAEVGEELFARLCASCHGEEGTEPVGEENAVINSEDYWGASDDATILRDIGIGSHGQMTAFAEEYGGPLSWEQILALAAHVRSWGPLTAVPEAPTGGALTYQDTIGPLLTERCSECHGGIAGLTVTDYESLMGGADAGPVIVSGDAEASRIVEVLQEGHYAELSAEELNRLIEWIDSGAPEQ